MDNQKWNEIITFHVDKGSSRKVLLQDILEEADVSTTEEAVGAEVDRMIAEGILTESKTGWLVVTEFSPREAAEIKWMGKIDRITKRAGWSRSGEWSDWTHPGGWSIRLYHSSPERPWVTGPGDEDITWYSESSSFRIAHERTTCVWIPLDVLVELLETVRGDS